MANYVTHIGEIDASILSPEETTRLEQKFRLVRLDGKLYFNYETAWHNDMGGFEKAAELLNGKPFKAYVYEEDPGHQIGEGMVTGVKKIGSQVEWYEDGSDKALEKFEEFVELNRAIRREESLALMFENFDVTDTRHLLLLDAALHISQDNNLRAGSDFLSKFFVEVPTEELKDYYEDVLGVKLSGSGQNFMKVLEDSLRENKFLHNDFISKRVSESFLNVVEDFKAEQYGSHIPNVTMYNQLVREFHSEKRNNKDHDANPLFNKEGNAFTDALIEEIEIAQTKANKNLQTKNKSPLNMEQEAKQINLVELERGLRLKTTPEDDFDLLKLYVVQRANGVEKHQEESVFQKFYKKLNNDSMKDLFQNYYDREMGIDKGFVSSFKNLVSGKNPSAEERLAETLAEGYSRVMMETTLRGASAQAKKDSQAIMDRTKLDINVKLYKLEAKSLLSGQYLVLDEYKEAKIEYLKGIVSERNEVIVKQAKRINELEVAYSKVVNAYNTLVTNVKKTFGLSDEKMNELKGLPVAKDQERAKGKENENGQGMKM